MKAVGIVVEYNPFHNGHAHHVEQSLVKSNADVVIAVMSGSFLQRGEPALLSKWNRTKMALLGGVDVVIELPYAFATQKAEVFARGALEILGSCGCEYICFGSESGHIEDFYSTIQFLSENHTKYEENIKKNMTSGMSYPKATSTAFHDLQPPETIMNLSLPNNILGYHYLRAIETLKLPITPLTVARKNAGYHDSEFSSDRIASATSIRKSIFTQKGQIMDLDSYVPTSTFQELMDYQNQFGQFHNWESYWPLLQYRLLTSSTQELSKIYEVEEGIEHRLIEMVGNADSFSEFMTLLKTKRYTWTRLQRLCTHILTNTSKEEMLSGMEKANYLRLLGMTSKGRQYLNKWKKQSELPIISRLASYPHHEIDLDIKAAKTYSLGAKKQHRHTLLAMEYSQHPIFINN